MDFEPRQGERTDTADLDGYLARCIAACLRPAPAPRWPEAIVENEAASRVAFHGIAMMLVEHPGMLASWPDAVAREVRDEARRQSFWETSHRPAIARLLDAFDRTGIDAIVTKGSALAYSVYPAPAFRRRGDSDIVIAKGSRRETRRVLGACGFEACGDARPLQESWQIAAPPNFIHQVDVHWRINASAAIAKRLEAIAPFSRAVPLASVSPAARGLAPVDNLLLVCINRAAHAVLGYRQGDRKLFEGDRLIWAVDIDLIARTLSPADWDALVARASDSGMAASLASSLAFARESCGTAVPDGVLEALSETDQPDELIRLLDPRLANERLKRDLAAGQSFGERTRILRFALFPSRQFLREKFPDLAHWPTPLLGALRLVSGLGKGMRGSATNGQ